MKTVKKMYGDTQFVSGGGYGTEKEFPPQIQERIDAGMGCGSSIGVGWLPVLIELDAKLAEIDPDYVIDQIKEKFGGLRYYVTTSVPRHDEEGKFTEAIDEFHALINNAEIECYTMCEVCGEPGEQVNPNGWVSTRCPKHTPVQENDDDE